MPPNASVIKIQAKSRQLQYLCFLAGLGHDLGKLFDMDLWAGDRRWSPLHETYAEFVTHIEVEPVHGIVQAVDENSADTSESLIF